MLALLLLAACAPPAPAAPPERIILIVADTLRRDFLSPYGSPVATPHVARLAERGQVFTNAVASFNQTTMSMSAMFTGRTPSIEGDGRRRTLPWTSQSWCGMARFALQAVSLTMFDPARWRASISTATCSHRSARTNRSSRQAMIVTPPDSHGDCFGQ